MYYSESLQLQAAYPRDVDVIARLDRLIAHAYAPGGRGRMDETWLLHMAGVGDILLRELMTEYGIRDVVQAASELICNCGVRNDPGDELCIACGEALTAASPAGTLSYLVLKQPREPVYDPHHQPIEPDVMISYRRADCGRLASDIYYYLRHLGKSVFIDRGDIPPGADAPMEYLRAASRVKSFIMLVSSTYFESAACKLEIAHAARAGARILRVNIPPLPTIPSGMNWVNKPNWLAVEGSSKGLDRALEEALRAAIDVPAGAGFADHRNDGCLYLMERMSLDQLETLWNRAGLSANRKFPDSKPESIRLIEQELVPNELDRLCALLAV